MLIDQFINSIKPHVDPNEVKVILDVGTRDLEQSFELASVYPNAHIYAFEPNPESFKKCQQILKESKLADRVTIYPFAILDYDGETTFYSVAQADNHGASSVFEPTDEVVGVDRVEGLERIVVGCRRLDSWAKEQNITKIDLAWLDTQGCELPALKGFGSLLDGVKAIATEVATGPLYYPNRQYQPTQYEELKKFLEGQGFTEVSYHQPWPLEADICYARVKK